MIFDMLHPRSGGAVPLAHHVVVPGIGAIHESMNMAAIWKLPVLFVCENNGFAEFTPRSAHTRVERVSDGWGPDTESLNRADSVIAISVSVAINARCGNGPWLIRATPAAATAARTVVTPEPNRGVAVGDLIPDFALTDQTGHTVRLSQMRGGPVAVTFLYTRCPIATACPMTATKFAKLDSLLKERGFGKILTITVDPEHDTPKVLAEYAKRLGADPARWKFLTGDPKAVADVATSFGVLYYPDAGQVVHGQAAAVVDPAGRLATIYYGQSWDPEHLLRDLEKARKG